MRAPATCGSSRRGVPAAAAEPAAAGRARAGAALPRVAARRDARSTTCSACSSGAPPSRRRRRVLARGPRRAAEGRGRRARARRLPRRSTSTTAPRRPACRSSAAGRVGRDGQEVRPGMEQDGLAPEARGYFEQAVADMNRLGRRARDRARAGASARTARRMGGAAYDRLNDELTTLPRRPARPPPVHGRRPARPGLVRRLRERVLRRHPPARREHAQDARERGAGGRPCSSIATSSCSRFLPLVLLGWWALRPPTPRLAFLTVMSYVFYAWWDWRFLGLMWLSTGIDYVAGHMIARATDRSRARLYLIVALTANLALLGYFKYAGFFLDSLHGIGSALGARHRPARRSTSCCRSASRSTRSTRCRTRSTSTAAVQPARNVVHYAAFVAMFPHLSPARSSATPTSSRSCAAARRG